MLSLYVEKSIPMLNGSLKILFRKTLTKGLSVSPSYIELSKGTRIYQNYAPLRKDCPPLVFVHGMWGHALLFAIWLNLCEYFGFRAYSIELPKHHSNDRSGLGSQSVTDHYVPAVSEAIDFIGNCVVVGWSMGGVISALVASRNSNVKKLVLLASGCFRGTFVGWSTLIKLRKPQYLFATAFRKEYKIKPGDSRSLMFNYGFSDKQFEVYQGTLAPESGRATLEMILGPELPEEGIPCPVLVIGGERDTILPPSVQRKTAVRLGAEYIEIPGSSHAIMLQEGVREETLEIVLEWLYNEVPSGHTQLAA